jgi:predicted lipoprotein with Yx(FWY)xxD motif
MSLPTWLHGVSRRWLLFGPLSGLAIVATACGSAAANYPTPSTGTGAPPAAGSAPDYAPPASTSPPAAAAAAAVTIGVRSSKLGTFLTDGQGRTLYLFEKDQGTMSACVGACLGVWPAVTTTGAVQAGPGVTQSLLSTAQRADGTTEVTYNGHPLYHYVGDSNPGDTNGQGLNQFGAGWYVLSPQGAKIDND